MMEAIVICFVILVAIAVMSLSFVVIDWLANKWVAKQKSADSAKEAATAGSSDFKAWYEAKPGDIIVYSSDLDPGGHTNLV